MKTKKLLLCSVALCYTTVGFAQHQNGFQSFFGLESTEWNGVTEYYDVPWENLQYIGIMAILKAEILLLIFFLGKILQQESYGVDFRMGMPI